MKTKLYCVVYRTGGTENFTWKRTLPVMEVEEATIQQLSLLEAGYKAMLQDYDQSLRLGLPETH